LKETDPITSFGIPESLLGTPPKIGGIGRRMNEICFNFANASIGV